MRVFVSHCLGLLVKSRQERSYYNGVIPRPYTYDGDEGDDHEDDVQAEQQTVDDYPDHLPVLWLFAYLEVTVHLVADGPEVSAQIPQFFQDRLSRRFLWGQVTGDALKSFGGNDAGSCGWFCRQKWKKANEPVKTSNLMD